MTIKLKDYHLLIALLLTSFFSVYFMPAMFSRMIFLVILAAAYRTKLNYVYLVWFFIINDAPGRLFSAGEFAVEARIPLYPVAAGISIGFQELFLILYIVKFFSRKKRPQFIFKQEFTWFLLFGCFVAGYSFFLGMSFDNMIMTFRFLLPWSLIFIVPTYIYNKKILVRASLLLFPVVLLALFSQVFSYFTGKYFDHFLRGTESRLIWIDKDAASRSVSSAYLILFSIIQALYFFFCPKPKFNRNYLGLVIFTGFLSIFLSASRGWVIALSVMLLGVLALFGFSRGITSWFRLAIVSSVVFFLAVSQFPIIQQQFNASYQRIRTIEALYAGDITAGGTLQRLDVRAPRVMSKFWSSPFVGWGFSNDYYKYHDGHVGHHNILLNIGVLGYVFVTGLFICLCIKIWRLAGKKEIRTYEASAPLIYVLGLLSVFVIHSSSVQFWGYTLSMEQILFFGFLFAAVNAVLLYRRHQS